MEVRSKTDIKWNKTTYGGKNTNSSFKEEKMSLLQT